MAISVNCSFQMDSIDISAVFFQEKVFDREVFIKASAGSEKVWKALEVCEAFLWFDEACSIFWLRTKETLFRMGLKVMD